ncbi:uncharacterized protein LOC132862265 isoform X2 [Tachysurus vachellii]|uniref:uncharacterized protein LOC132862265 isoform X2 n=1 Tax=Tachysurus vachellii TaxID=175792 RepID=UPI00296B4B2C|nr:uncharacterized protein LOC132862265 isoform X2 [Tachysurus vachellii]
MMNILLIFTLSLISDPVACVMTGYTGGSVLIISDLNWGSGFSTYICKLGSRSCTDIIRTDTTENSVQEERFKLYKNNDRFLRVLIRRLKPQDAGVYRIGVEDQMPTDLELTVLNDTSENSQNNRFSISDDSSAKVLSMSISHVTEADNGVYLYGIFNRKKSIQYFSFFREIHLNVRESLVNTTIIIIIISVCVLLIGGFTLLVIYKLRHKGTQGSRPSSQDNEHAPSVHENNLPNLPTYENLKIKMRSNDQNLDSSTSQSDSTYQTLDPRTNQSDSNYMSLSNTTDQSHSHYQCLNARTQVNSVYQTLHS